VKETKNEEFNKRLRDKGINYERKTFKKDDFAMHYWDSKNHIECTDHHIAIEGLEFLAENGWLVEIYKQFDGKKHSKPFVVEIFFDIYKGETVSEAVFAALKGVA
jgi:hypothetical protein